MKYRNTSMKGQEFLIVILSLSLGASAILFYSDGWLGIFPLIGGILIGTLWGIFR